MKYIAVIDTDDIENLRFYEDSDGKYLVARDANSESDDGKIEELFERVENIEKQIKEDKEAQLKKLKAEIDYAKFRLTISKINDIWRNNNG